MKPAPLLLAVCLLFISATAQAHTGYETSGWLTGLAHPFSGLDHLLAMLAIGLWAGQQEKKFLWQLPVTFMLALSAGACASLFIPLLPLIEPGIAASVLALGLLISANRRVPWHFSLCLTITFGVFHGYAHGSEMPGAAAPAAYVLGFLCATAALHFTGIAFSRSLHARYMNVVQATGIGIAACGAWMLAN